MPEPLPIKDVLDELDTQWNVSNVAEPKFIEVTGATNDPLRFNLNVGDVVFGRAGDPALEETPIGNWTLTGDALITGDLTVEGATITIESTTIAVDDKNIELGSSASPSGPLRTESPR